MGLFMIAVLVSYGYMKLMIMIDFQDNKIQEPTQSEYFDQEYIYDSSDGWRVAFGLVAYDASTD